MREAEDRISPADRDSRAFEASKHLLLAAATPKWLLLEDDPHRDPAPRRFLQRAQDRVVADEVDLQVDRAPRALNLVEDRGATVTWFDEDPSDRKRRRFAGLRDL